MKFFVAFIFLPLSVFAQTAKSPPAKCEIGLANAPVLRGISLRMTVAQVAKKYPLLPAPENNKITTLNGYVNNIPGFDNVNFVRISFLDQKVSSIHLFYDETPFESAGEFSKNLSKQWNLPESAWHYWPSDNGILVCDGFSLSIFENKYILLRDTDAEAKKDAEKKAAFRP